jgi:erythrin-vacuolar iron transport family protein
MPAPSPVSRSFPTCRAASELLILAWLRHKFFHTSFARSFLAVTVGGAIIASLSAALGLAAGG